MALVSTGIIVREWAPPNGYCQGLYHQGESQLPPASLRGSVRSASGSDPGFFQTAVSALELRTCEILHTPFKSGVSVSCPLSLLNIALLVFKARHSDDSSSWCRNPGLGSLMWLRPLTPWGGPPKLWYSSSLWVANLEVWVLTIPHFYSSYLFHFFVFSCGKSLLLVFRSFS